MNLTVVASNDMSNSSHSAIRMYAMGCQEEGQGEGQEEGQGEGQGAESKKTLLQ